MRSLATALAILALLALPLEIRADDSPTAKEVLEKAAAALAGGKDKTAALGNITLKGKGTANEGGAALQYEFEMSIQDLDKARIDLTMTVQGMPHKITIVMSGDNMWAHDLDKNSTEDAPPDAKPATQSFLLALTAAANPLAIAKLKDVELTHGGEGKIGDASAWVIQIRGKDRSDLTIYFDQKTGLPLKSETLIKEPSDKQRDFGFQFSEFKTKDGVKYFSKIKIDRDGADLAEIELTEFKAGAKFESSTFEKP